MCYVKFTEMFVTESLKYQPFLGVQILIWLLFKTWLKRDATKYTQHKTHNGRVISSHAYNPVLSLDIM